MRNARNFMVVFAALQGCGLPGRNLEDRDYMDVSVMGTPTDAECVQLVQKDGETITLIRTYHEKPHAPSEDLGVPHGWYSDGKAKFRLRKTFPEAWGILTRSKTRAWRICWFPSSCLRGPDNFDDYTITLRGSETWLDIGDDFLLPLGIRYGLRRPRARQRNTRDGPWDTVLSHEARLLRWCVSCCRSGLRTGHAAYAQSEALRLMALTDRMIACYDWPQPEAASLEKIYEDFEALWPSLAQETPEASARRLDVLEETLRQLCGTHW